MFTERIPFATRYTRYLDKHDLLRFQNWKPFKPAHDVPSSDHRVLYYCYGIDMFFLWSAQSG
jgi:hypothetical protein